MLMKPIIILIAGISLTACANIAKTPANTPLQQIIAQHGQPDTQCTNKSQQTRVIWSQQPMGQYAWGGNLNDKGELIKIEPVLTDEHFQALKNGDWTPDEVLCEFGPPAIIDSVGLPSNRQIVWSYRYKQDHVWNSLMFIYFGSDGQRVTKFHPGPDPMFDRDMNWFF